MTENVDVYICEYEGFLNDLKNLGYKTTYKEYVESINKYPQKKERLKRLNAYIESEEEYNQLLESEYFLKSNRENSVNRGLYRLIEKQNKLIEEQNKLIENQGKQQIELLEQIQAKRW